MVTLVVGKPVISRVPTLLVENALAVGRFAFQLVVVDDQGNVSLPVRLLVTVGPAGRPPVPIPVPTPIPRPVPIPDPVPIRTRTTKPKPKTKPPKLPT